MTTIYSKKFNNFILWNDTIPAGYIYLNITETDKGIQDLLDEITNEIIGEDEIDEDEIEVAKAEAFNRLDDERMESVYRWIKTEDIQNALEESNTEIEWENNEFIFPGWIPESEIGTVKAMYSLLKEYNIAYQKDVTNLDEKGYKLYSKMHAMIKNQETDLLRLKTFEGGKNSPILFMNDPFHRNSCEKVSFEDSEILFDICKRLQISYPWEMERKNRIHLMGNESISKVEHKVYTLMKILKETQGKIVVLKKEESALIEQLKNAEDECTFVKNRIKDKQNLLLLK